jgi:ribosomal protein S17
METIQEVMQQEEHVSHNIYAYRKDNLIREGDTVIVYEGADNMK